MSGCCSFIRSLSTAFILSCVSLLKYSARLSKISFGILAKTRPPFNTPRIYLRYSKDTCLCRSRFALVRLLQIPNLPHFFRYISCIFKTLNGSTNPSMTVPASVYAHPNWMVESKLFGFFSYLSLRLS